MDTRQLEWERGGEWFIWTRCRRYSVAKTMTGDEARYSPFRLGPLGVKYAPPSQLIGDVCLTAKEAMAVCAEHAAREQSPKAP